MVAEIVLLPDWRDSKVATALRIPRQLHILVCEWEKGGKGEGLLLC